MEECLNNHDQIRKPKGITAATNAFCMIGKKSYFTVNTEKRKHQRKPEVPPECLRLRE
jgi:hypothetical protein